MDFMFRLCLGLLLSFPLMARDRYLFTSFRGDGETGVFFALSSDGRDWKPLNDNQPWLKPEIPGMLMRDPWLGRGPDGVWHMLWTWGWTRGGGDKSLKIGTAESKDLIHWSAQRAIPVLADETSARNAWAPEAAWDAARREWILFWATTIPGRFASTEGTGDSGYNHRIYSTTTHDWKTFSPVKLLFDPGFNCIDSTMVHDGKRWIMIFKDERKTPLEKRLRLAFADSPAGPWTGITEPFTRDWVEGPSAIRIGSEWWIYFDHYTKPQGYGAVRTRDWKTFEDVSEQVHFPADHRHGTVVPIDEKTANQLILQKR
jgi:hypothetical protein